MRLKSAGCKLARAWSPAVLLASMTAYAEDTALPLASGGDALGLPSVGKVCIAFVVAATLALAVGAALRRFVPKLTGALLVGGNSLRAVERLQLAADLRVHLVEVGRSRVLITAHRNSISVVVLEASQAAEPAP